MTANIPNWSNVTSNTTDYIVGPGGTYTTIQAAIDAAPSGQVVFIKAGTYTEDLTLKAGVNLAAYGNSGFTPVVTIVGKASFDQTGVVTISGVKLQTNGDYAISITGTNSSRIFLTSCYLVAQDFRAIEMTSTNTGTRLRIVDSWCLTNTNAFSFFTVNGTGHLTFWNVNVLDSTPQTIASDFSSTGALLVKHSIIRFPITTSGTGRLTASHSEFNTYETNSTPLTVGGTATGLGNYTRGCIFMGGTNPALTLGAGAVLNMLTSTVLSSNADPISGTGTLRQCGASYNLGDPIPRTTTLTLQRKAFDGGKLWGNWDGTDPAAGYLGEQISSIIAYNGAVVSLTTGTVSDVMSIVLTAGTWDISAIAMFSNGSAADAWTYQEASIGSTSGAIANSTYGNNTITSTFTSTLVNDVGLAIPSFRENVPKATGTRTIYLKVRAGFAGTANAYGRISATRVA